MGANLPSRKATNDNYVGINPARLAKERKRKGIKMGMIRENFKRRKKDPDKLVFKIDLRNEFKITMTGFMGRIISEKKAKTLTIKINKLGSGNYQKVEIFLDKLQIGESNVTYGDIIRLNK